MNKNQKIALAVGLLAFLAAVLFPPMPGFYGLGWPIFAHPDSVNWAAVCVEWFVIAVLTAGSLPILGGAR